MTCRDDDVGMAAECFVFAFVADVIYASDNDVLGVNDIFALF
jgi:hypothetical protein